MRQERTARGIWRCCRREGRAGKINNPRQSRQCHAEKRRSASKGCRHEVGQINWKKWSIRQNHWRANMLSTTGIVKACWIMSVKRNRRRKVMHDKLNVQELRHVPTGAQCRPDVELKYTNEERVSKRSTKEKIWKRWKDELWHQSATWMRLYAAIAVHTLHRTFHHFVEQ